jgi:hypothetical protein
VSNVEQEEAKKALDSLAREIHGIYGQHAAESGLKTPKWEDLPEGAKMISRDIARLAFSKMVEAQLESAETRQIQTAERSGLNIPLPKSWSAKEAIEFVKGVKPEVDEIINRILTERIPNPVAKGIDKALEALAERTAIGIISNNDDILTKLHSTIEDEIRRLLDDKEEA